MSENKVFNSAEVEDIIIALRFCSQHECVPQCPFYSSGIKAYGNLKERCSRHLMSRAGELLADITGTSK